MLFWMFWSNVYLIKKICEIIYVYCIFIGRPWSILSRYLSRKTISFWYQYVTNKNKYIIDKVQDLQKTLNMGGWVFYWYVENTWSLFISFHKEETTLVPINLKQGSKNTVMSEMRLFCLYITWKPNQNIPRSKNSSKDQ
jgi:hypothetical protein